MNQFYISVCSVPLWLTYTFQVCTDRYRSLKAIYTFVIHHFIILLLSNQFEDVLQDSVGLAGSFCVGVGDLSLFID